MSALFNLKRGIARALGVLAFAGIAATASAPAMAAPPPAGTAIGNQASATYTDASNTPRTVTSNLVTAIVQQVSALTLAQTAAKTVAVGSQVSYPLTLTNTGNGTDTFALSSTNSGAFGFTSVVFYADANGDGIADNTTPITSTTALAMGDVFRFVAVGTVPTTAVSGNTNAMVVTAVSGFNAATGTASVTETTTVTSQAVINVSKSMSTATGLPGSGPHTITLTYNNNGNTAATAVALGDLLPAGMTYVAGSGRWSATGATVLTDAIDGTQGTSPTIAYSFSAGQVSAVINTVAPGQSGTVSFQVTINAYTTATYSGQLAGAVNNTATYSYNDGAVVIPSTNTNTFAFTVSPVTAVTVTTPPAIATATQGSTISLSNVFRNNGNAPDSFDVTIGSNSFPAGTSFALYQADGVTPLLDTNGNGISDTGTLASGATYSVVMRVTLPPNAGAGGPYSVDKTAASRANPAITATVTDTLTAIVANSVDLTNTSALPGAPGAGPGPEATPVTTQATNPGTTTRFSLYVNNTSAVSDTYNLAASTDASFATAVLPAGWTVVFRDAATNAVITNSGVINGGANKQIYADVSVPANQAALPAGQSIYFRVLSPTSGSADRKHDMVTVNTIRALQITTNQTGQVFPGSSIVYSATLQNTGNVTENSGGANTVTLSLTDTQATFSSIVYRDANNNGVIDPTDPAVLSAADLGSIAAGASVPLLVRVTAAPGAATGIVDTTTLRVTTAGSINTVAAPAIVSITDTTTVISGNLVLLKEQALDANCDGTADTAFSSANIAAGAIPGACVRYRITITNIGASNVLTVVVSDATPANTTYHAVVPAASSQGAAPTAPAAGAAGTISAAVGTLAPSASATVTFGVRINP
jgi:trimeric autotransporter adhesin